MIENPVISTKPTKRILAIDLIRGFLLVVIIVDHLGRFPNGYELFTGRAALWATAAEGFFFISGMMVGVTRARKVATEGFAMVWKKLWHRSFILYAWSVILTLGFTLAAFGIGRAPKGGLIETRVWGEILSQALTLHYAYGWSDFLPRYAIFMFISPLAAYLLAKGWWWLVGVGSVGLWLLWGPTHFNVAWQLLFFGGMIIGYYLPQIEQSVRQLSKQRQQELWWAGIGLTVMTVVVSGILNLTGLLFYDAQSVVIPATKLLGHPEWYANLPAWAQQANQWVKYWFDHDSMAIGRVLAFSLWFSLGYAAVRRYEQQLNRWCGWLFLPLGRRSLTTYIVHAMVVFGVDAIMPDHHQFGFNFVQTTVIIALVWLVVTRVNFGAVMPRVMATWRSGSASWSPALTSWDARRWTRLAAVAVMLASALVLLAPKIVRAVVGK